MMDHGAKFNSHDSGGHFLKHTLLKIAASRCKKNLQIFVILSCK